MLTISISFFLTHHTLKCLHNKAGQSILGTSVKHSCRLITKNKYKPGATPFVARHRPLPKLDDSIFSCCLKFQKCRNAINLHIRYYTPSRAHCHLSLSLSMTHHTLKCLHNKADQSIFGTSL